MKKIRVAVVGSGFTGLEHYNALRRLPYVEVAAMSDVNIDSLKEKNSSLLIENIFADYKQMIDTVKPDVIHNCTPNSSHFEINMHAIHKGIHVYSEKPLAITLDEGKKLMIAAGKANVANGVNFNYRNNPMVQEMRNRVITGDAGRCFLVHGSYLQDWLMLESDYNWRLNADVGGASRAVADIGSHWFDTAQTVLGKKIIAVNSSLFTTHLKRKKPEVQADTFKSGAGAFEYVDINTEDGAFITVQFEDGVIGSVVVSQVSGGYKNSQFISVDCENYSMRWQQEDADKLIIGSREVAETKVYSAQGTLTGAANAYASLPAGHAMAWRDALHNGVSQFYESIRNNTYACGNPYATFADAYYIMRIVDACLKSSNDKVWVNV